MDLAPRTVTALAPVLDGFVALGTLDSAVGLVQVPRPLAGRTASAAEPHLDISKWGTATASATAPWGKCARRPVAALSYNESLLSALTQVSQWDVLRGCKVKNYTQTLYQISTVRHWTPNVALFAGDNANLSCVDLRSRRTWNIPLCKDNITSLAIDGHKVVLGDMSGALTALDMRTWKASMQLHDSAVLAVELSHVGTFVALEDRVLLDNDVVDRFRQGSCAIGLDVAEYDTVSFACGSGNGVVHYYIHNGTLETHLRQIGTEPVQALAWGSLRLFAGCGQHLHIVSM